MLFQRIVYRVSAFAADPNSEITLRLFRRQAGQGMVEYSLILVLVSIVVIVMLLTMGRTVKNVFSNVSRALGSV